MSFKDFKIIETLGKGSFASVYKVIRRSDNKTYALKRVKISKMSKKDLGDALNEIRFLASIRQKNIVGFLHAFLENNETELCIIMEYCGCGDLAQKVERYKKRRQYIDEHVIWKYLIQCLKALKHLHDKNICHRDLKCANTFLAEDGSVKIGDMNVSKKLKKGQLQTQIGTPYYMSPEIWNNRPYDAKSDLWSLGCMMYELCALRPPFLGDTFPQLKRAITAGKYTPIPSKYTSDLHKVIASMLTLDPRQRCTAESLLNSPEMMSKLHLDMEQETVFAASKAAKDAAMGMLNTIKVPMSLLQLPKALPKPCYPDVRPNSPSAWTAAEQKKAARKPAPLPPVPTLPLPPVDEAGKDHTKNTPAPAPLPTNRSDDGSVRSKGSKKGRRDRKDKENKTPREGGSSRSSNGKHSNAPNKLPSAKYNDKGHRIVETGPVGAPAVQTEGGPPPSGMVPNPVLDDYYNRRPLAPVSQAGFNSRPTAYAEQRDLASKAGQALGMPPPSFNRPQYQPSLNAIPAGAAGPPANMFKQAPHAPHAPASSNASAGSAYAGRPTRLQYHHRAW